jgi:hypothetical protein
MDLLYLTELSMFFRISLTSLIHLYHVGRSLKTSQWWKLRLYICNHSQRIISTFSLLCIRHPPKCCFSHPNKWSAAHYPTASAPSLIQNLWTAKPHLLNMPHILKVCTWLQMPVAAANVKCYMLHITLFNMTTAKIILHCSQMNEVWSNGKKTLTGGN